MTELVSINEGGAGIDWSNSLFRLKPGTVAINQPNTQVDGAIKGKLRITETGQQFDDMLVTLLKMPVRQRAYYTGNSGQMNRTPENLTCYSRDMIRPDSGARTPQAMTCASCQHGDIGWTRYRETKAKEDIPQCDSYWYAMFIDTVLKIPLQMYIRSKSKKPFEAGMEQVTRTLFMMKSQGLNPNVFDLSFKISTKKIITGALPSYVLNISDIQAITPEQQEAFGKLYLQFANRVEEEPETDTIEADAQVIEGKILGPSVGQYDGEDIKL